MPRPKNGKRRAHLKLAAAARWAKSDYTEVVKPVASEKSASRKKIEIMNAVANVDEVQEQNWTLLHVFQLTRLLCDLDCPECSEPGLSVNVCEGENAGFAAKLALRCDGCGYEKFEFSSPRIGDSDKKNVAFEVNRRMTMFSHETGGSHSVLQTFSTVMGIPGMHLKTFQGHDKKVTDDRAGDDSTPADAVDVHEESLEQMLQGSTVEEFDGLPCTSDEDMPSCSNNTPSASQETTTQTALDVCDTEDEEGEEKQEDAVIDFATKNIPALAETFRSAQTDFQAVFLQRKETAPNELKNSASDIKISSQEKGETCCVLGCGAGHYKGFKSLFPFPAKKARCNQWLWNMGREDLLEKTPKQLRSEGYKVCSSHFKPHYLLHAGQRVRLARNAVPTLNKSGRRQPQKKKSLAEKSSQKQKENKSRGRTEGRPEAAVLPEIKVEFDWAVDPALLCSAKEHSSCSDADSAEKVDDSSSLSGPVQTNSCEMGASSSQADSVGYVKSDSVEEGEDERFLSGSGELWMESAWYTRTVGYVESTSVGGENQSLGCVGDKQVPSCIKSEPDDDEMSASSWSQSIDNANIDLVSKFEPVSSSEEVYEGSIEHMNCGHTNSEHMNCDHVNSEHMNCGHINSEHMKCDCIDHEHMNCDQANSQHMNWDHVNSEHMNYDHVNSEHMNYDHYNREHMNCDHDNSEHRSSSDVVTSAEPVDSNEQVCGGDRRTSTADVTEDDDWDMSYTVVKAEPQSDSDTEDDRR